MVSAYGAAGSLVVLLMWIFLSSAILLYSAGCAKAVEEARREHEGRRQAAANDLRWAASNASTDTTLMASSSHKPRA